MRTPTTVSSTRTLLFPSIAIHRVSQMMSAKHSMSEYPTLHHYRNAASKRLPFHQTLRVAAEHLIKKRLQLSNLPQQIDVANFQSPPAKKTTQNNQWIRKANFIHALRQGITPTKGSSSNPKVKTIYHEAREIRNSECLGISLVFISNKDGDLKRPHCQRCGKQVSSFCTGCKRPLCVNQKRPIGNDDTTVYEMDQLKMIKEKEGNDWEQCHFIRSCYQIEHEEKWAEYWGKRRRGPSELDRLMSKKAKK